MKVVNHCPVSDDEKLCDLKKCPEQCSCFLYSTICKGLDSIAQIHQGKIFTVKNLKVENSNIFFSVELLQYFDNLLIAKFPKCFITSICPSINTINQGNKHERGKSRQVSSILEMSLENNLIQSLLSKCFQDLKTLKHLVFRHNSIHTIETQSFHGLRNLKHLDLSHNKLITLKEAMFRSLTSLNSLHLSGNMIESVEPSTFNGFQLSVIHTDNFIICCVAEKSMIERIHCSAVKSYISSCDDLLASFILRSLVWIMAVSSFMFNVISIHLYQRSRIKKPHDFMVAVLNACDLLLSIYLVMLAVTDMRMRGEFVGLKNIWTSGITCKVMSVLSLLSMLSSMYMLCLITFVRYRVIKSPIKTNFKEMSTIYKFCIAGCSIIFTLVGLMSIYFYGTYANAPNTLCLLLSGSSITSDSAILYLLTTILMTCQLLSLFLIIFLYYLLLNAIKSSQKNLRKDGKSKTVSVRIILVTVTNMLCWLPSSIVYVLLLSNYPVSPKTLSWVAVFILPINAALNPSIALFTRRDFQESVHKIFSQIKLHPQNRSFTLSNMKDS